MQASADENVDGHSHGTARQFEIGDVVVIHGLIKSTELNQQIGIIIGFAVDTSRFIVDLIGDDEQLSGKTVRVKHSNLLSAVEAEDMLDVEAAAFASPPSVATALKDQEAKSLHPISGVASDEFSTMPVYSEPSQPLCSDGLGPSCSMTVGRQT